MATHLEAGEDDILISNGDVCVGLGGAEVEDGVQCQLKLRASPNERTPYWFHLYYYKCRVIRTN